MRRDREGLEEPHRQPEVPGRRGAAASCLRLQPLRRQQRDADDRLRRLLVELDGVVERDEERRQRKRRCRRHEAIPLDVRQLLGQLCRRYFAETRLKRYKQIWGFLVS